MSMVIALKGFDLDAWMKRLKGVMPDREISSWPELTVAPESVKYLLAWKAPEEVYSAFPNLEVIFSLGAGVDHIMSLDVVADVPIVRSVDPSLTNRMTEWVVLQVLQHHRTQRLYDRQQAHSVWQSHNHPVASEVRVGILGLGELGLASAKALKALGFQVSSWSRSPKQEEGITSFAGEDQLTSFLNQTDILVNLLPLTTQTKGLVSYDFLKELAQDGAGVGPVYINAGRGATQNEDDLVRALDDGTLKGASIDVFAVEPLAKESPLWAQPNCIITPHVAAESDPEALARYYARQIEAYEAGGPLENLVEKDRGY